MPSPVCLRLEEHRKRKKERRSRRRHRSTRRRRRRRRKRNRRARVGSDRKRTRTRRMPNVPARRRRRRRAALASPLDRQTPWRCVASSSRGAVARLPRTRRAPRARRGRRRGLSARIPTRTRKQTQTQTKTLKRRARASGATRSAFPRASFPRTRAWFARTFGPARPSSPAAPRTRSRLRARGTSSRRTGGGASSPARTACFVAVAEPGRGGTFSAARGPASPYAPLPTHRTYAWYKQFGFAGKGASSSWGFNPKRADLFAAYAKASATRENPRRRQF